MARTTGSTAVKTEPLVRAAALRLFAQHGYAAVSMRQIAAEVGVQAGALYRYTPDKQTLLFDLLRNHMEELLEAWQSADQAGYAEDRLARFVRFHIAHHLQRPDAVFVSYMELRNLTDENFAVIEDMRRIYETALESILQDGVGASRFALADTKLTTLAIIAMLTGVTTWYRDGGRLDRVAVEDIYVDMVARAVGGEVLG